MEVLEIKSSHDLTAHMPAARRSAARSYLISCRQFTSVLADSRKPGRLQNTPPAPDATMGFMTLSADQIWMTPAEIDIIQDAIRSAHSPVSLP